MSRYRGAGIKEDLPEGSCVAAHRSYAGAILKGGLHLPRLLHARAARLRPRLGDGGKHRFGAGTALLAEDITGQGHTTLIVNGEPVIQV
jgi:hypothetical protein